MQLGGLPGITLGGHYGVGWLGSNNTGTPERRNYYNTTAENTHTMITK